MGNPSAYLPPNALSRPVPLERFLPPCPAGVMSQAADQTPVADGWLLDPFGSTPLLPLELAQQGHKVLVTCNNPILAFCIKQLAQPGSRERYLSMLAELASQKRGEERLETHIKSLYQTRCAICHQEIQASAFLWRRTDATPYARVYHCPNCGDEGERAITEEDLARLQPIIRGEKVHRARAMSKLLKEDQEDRTTVEDALKVYNPRALYVLFTLLNKIEGMYLVNEDRSHLQALMISLLDAGTSLWPSPPTLETSHQLTVPQEYLEKNLWHELEESINLWTQPTAVVECTQWPKIPSAGGIALFEGPIRAIKDTPDQFKISQLVCLPPRPNQAFWTLSALWSAWLWGANTGVAFRAVLGRRRFDWHWHTQAMQQALEKAVCLAHSEATAFIQIGEPSAGMVLATLMAARTSGLELTASAYRSPDGIQFQFKMAANAPRTKAANLQSVCRTAIRNLLNELGEPCDYLRLYTAAVTEAILSNGLPGTIEEFTLEKSSDFQGMIARIFSDRAFLRRFDVSSQEFESGTWWLVNAEPVPAPLADRLEIVLVNLLQKQRSISALEVNRFVHQSFPGFQTPPGELSEYCLNSYADWDPLALCWNLREQELVAARRKDVEAATHALKQLGSKLGFEVSSSPSLSWRLNGRVHYTFYFSAAALLAKYVPAEDNAPVENVFVFPGSRAALLKYKLIRDPFLHERTMNRWHFLKFRTLAALKARADLTPALWTMLLDSDPISLEESQQLRMFG
jgi:hypothetical protein